MSNISAALSLVYRYGYNNIKDCVSFSSFHSHIFIVIITHVTALKTSYFATTSRMLCNDTIIKYKTTIIINYTNNYNNNNNYDNNDNNNYNNSKIIEEYNYSTEIMIKLYTVCVLAVTSKRGHSTCDTYNIHRG